MNKILLSMLLGIILFAGACLKSVPAADVKAAEDAGTKAVEDGGQRIEG